MDQSGCTLSQLRVRSQAGERTALVNGGRCKVYETQYQIPRIPRSKIPGLLEFPIQGAVLLPITFCVFDGKPPFQDLESRFRCHNRTGADDF